MTPAGAPTVFVIDDDADMRASIRGLLKSVGWLQLLKRMRTRTMMMMMMNNL